MRTKEETSVLHALLARRDNYRVTDLSHKTGRYYDVTMGDKNYTAVVLFSSFEYYTRRYHLADVQPNLCICMVHNTVLPIDTLALLKSNYAQAYELPEVIEDMASQRRGKTGSQVLLGQYLLGVHQAVDFVEDLPPTTRKRYQARAKSLGKRDRGRPVGGERKKKQQES